MIKANIKDIAEKNNVTTAYQLQKLLNIQPSLAAKWYRNDLRMIGFDSLNSLCKAFNCLPSDILVYVADDGVTAPQMPVAVPESSKARSIDRVVDISELKTMDVDEVFDRLKEKVSSGDFFKNSVLDIVQSSSDNETLLKTSVVAGRLGVSERTVRDYYEGKSGGVKLVSVEIGTKRFVSESDLNDFIARRGKK
jgi:DNA-binding Xre family transcriptional regulator